MDKIIEWLVDIEQKAADVYGAAAENFKDDKKLSEFLSNLAADEQWHHEVIQNAAEIVRSTPGFEPAVILDTSIRSKIEKSISACRDKLSSGGITISEVLDCIIDIEFSEWNDIFLYVIDTIKSRDDEFRSVALKVRAHREKIKLFVHSSPEGAKAAELIKKLPHVWGRNILIVENEPAIARFLSVLLEDEGVVQTAENGQMALDKISQQYFDVIIVDLNMPVMDGIELLKLASAIVPGIGRRFLFFSGYISNETIDFFEDQNIRFLLKPAPIKEILKKVGEILEETKDNAGDSCNAASAK